MATNTPQSLANATQLSPQDLVTIIAALVHRSGGNIKLKQSDFTKSDGKLLTIEARRGFVRMTTRSAK